MIGVQDTSFAMVEQESEKSRESEEGEPNYSCIEENGESVHVKGGGEEMTNLRRHR
ncbi:hypothetical protein H2248_002346 [Termitomyces sp. 'cryptogamus']|nr:hypothetical protein H2248_002346 [Termitomyces sp. 'cryptogamus']